MKNSLIKTDFTQERITFYLNSPDLAPPNYSEMSKKKRFSQGDRLRAGVNTATFGYWGFRLPSVGILIKKKTSFQDHRSEWEFMVKIKLFIQHLLIMKS
jgi:hypothetical protein